MTLSHICKKKLTVKILAFVRNKVTFVIYKPAAVNKNLN